MYKNPLNWLELSNEEKKQIIAQLQKDDIEMIQKLKKMFNGEVIILEVIK